jgi:hypothetical protein
MRSPIRRATSGRPRSPEGFAGGISRMCVGRDDRKKTVVVDAEPSPAPAGKQESLSREKHWYSNTKFTCPHPVTTGTCSSGHPGSSARSAST